MKLKNKMKKQELTDKYKKYELIKPDEINSDILEYLNHADINIQEYQYIFDNLYQKAVNAYKECIANKEKYLDIISEIIIASKYQIKVDKEIHNILLKKIYDKKYYDILLKYYKEYDCLNSGNNLIKILVSYIKPSFLFKTDILTPVHLGRAIEKEMSKDGAISDTDINWLHENCIGDDDFEGNISILNRRIGFFTGTYWAWKNYEKLGNPKYFGSFGYRRLLFPNCLNELDNYDFILPVKMNSNETLKEQMIKYHGQKLYEVLIEASKQVYPDEFKDIEKYMNGNEGYFEEIYIMRKDIFYDMCEWLFKMFKYLNQQYPKLISLLGNFLDIEIDEFYKKQLDYDIRDFAYIFERITGYYLYKLTKNKNLKYKETGVFEPETPHQISTKYKNIILEQLRKKIKQDCRRE